MGIASLVIGVISVLVGLLPLLGYLTVIPSVLGLVLGIVDIAAKTKQNKTKNEAIAGVVLNSFAIFCVAAWTVIIAVVVSRSGEEIKQFNLLLREQVSKYHLQQIAYKSDPEQENNE